MRILAVDYGDARTGLAICDEMEMLASPLDTIYGAWQPKVAEQIVQKAREFGVQEIVVGYPLNMDGSAGERAVKCKEFAQLLESLTGLPVHLWDERGTTISAHRALNETNTRGKKRKAVVDQVAAVVILQSYLEYRKCQ